MRYDHACVPGWIGAICIYKMCIFLLYIEMKIITDSLWDVGVMNGQSKCMRLVSALCHASMDRVICC